MVVYCMERAALAAEEAGVDKWVWIIDLARYTRANSPPLAITRATLDIMQHHYPERLFKYEGVVRACAVTLRANRLA